LLQRRGYAGLNEVLAKGQEQGMDEGREQGLEEGREQGLEEGLKRGRREGREEGREEALIEAILALLQDRGLAVEAEVEVRLRASHDPASLRRWLLLALAARVERAEALFDAESGSKSAAGPLPG
jgi:hypothetical protein